MLAIMPGQFVGSGEFPAATFPAANVWLFTRVSSQMGLQMTGFGVGFLATFVRTGMNRYFFLAPFTTPPFLDGPVEKIP